VAILEDQRIPVTGASGLIGPAAAEYHAAGDIDCGVSINVRNCALSPKLSAPKLSRAKGDDELPPAGTPAPAGHERAGS